MRIREFSVAELFGIFHHHVPLNLEDRITIVHGPNGFGKTVLLGMLDGLFNGEYAVFRRVPFREFQAALEDGRELRVHRFPSDVGGGDRILIHGPGPDQTFDITSPPASPVGVREAAPPAWLAELQGAVRVHSVRAGRLSSSPGTPSPTASAVAADSEDLAREMERALAQSVELSARLDASFPERLLAEIEGSMPPPTEAALRERFQMLHSKRRRLAEAGLLQGDEAGAEIPGDRLGEVARAALEVHARDAWARLQAFDGLLHRIELLKELVNSRFLYKSLSVHRDEGFVFTAAGGGRLPLAALSSGEQNELALLHELLFEVEPGALVLIDEPELSLHIAWQQEFLGDLSRITALSGFDVVLATHSPDIVGDRWDLTVELKGPESLV